MSQMTDAYAAGLIDGEGCIGINFHKNIYDLRIDVGMTSKALAILESLKRWYGGSVQLQRAATERWEAAYCWTVTGKTAAATLTRLQPFLRLKTEQAEVALKVAAIREALPKMPNSSRRWTQEARDRCAILKQRMHELNRKGPQPPIRSPANGRLIARFVAGQLVTDQADLFSDLGYQRFSGPWPHWAMTTLTGLYELPTPEHPTAANAGSASPGLLPTPQAFDARISGADISPGAAERQMSRTDGYERSTTGSLAKDIEILLKTPAAHLGSNGGSQHPHKRREGGHGPTLADQVEHLLPTPRTADGMNSNMQSNRDRHARNRADGKRWWRGTIEEAVSLLPTPAAHDSGNPPEAHLRKKPGRQQVTSLQVIVDHGLLPSGGRMDPPSPDGSTSSDGPHRGQLSLGEREN